MARTSSCTGSLSGGNNGLAGRHGGGYRPRFRLAVLPSVETLLEPSPGKKRFLDSSLIRSCKSLVHVSRGQKPCALRSHRPKPFAPMDVTSKPVRLLVQIAHT